MSARDLFFVQSHANGVKPSGESIARQGLHVRYNAFGKSVQPVPAFQHRNQPAAAEFIGEFHDDASHGGKALRSDVEMAQQIIAHAVESGADEHEIGFEVSSGGNETGHESRQ